MHHPGNDGNLLHRLHYLWNFCSIRKKKKKHFFFLFSFSLTTKIFFLFLFFLFLFFFFFCFFLFQYPHAVGYVADISTGDRAVGNQAKLSGVGYANGLACGYVMAVIILLGAGTGNAVVGYHGNFITISLITGLAIIGLGVITLITRLDESMP